VGSKRLLHLDGHTTHTTIKVVQFCKEKGILLFLTPPHLTHLVQPLDVGVFGPWKDRYIEAVNNSFRTGCTDFDKIELLLILDPIHKQTLHHAIIRYAWTKACLCPFNPRVVIEPLRQRVAPETPPPSQGKAGEISTPYSAQSFRKLSTHLVLLHAAEDDLEQALKRLIKGAATVANANKLLQKSLDETRAAHIRRQELKKASRRYVSNSGLVTLNMARKLVRTKHEKQEKEVQSMLERQIQRDIEQAAKKAENEARRKTKRVARFKRLMEQSRKQIARGFELNEKRGRRRLRRPRKARNRSSIVKKLH